MGEAHGHRLSFFSSIIVVLPCGYSGVSSISAEFAPYYTRTHHGLKVPGSAEGHYKKKKILELATNEGPVQGPTCPTMLLFRWGTLYMWR